jgi:FAD/FMN-containing dehydrogenase
MGARSSELGPFLAVGMRRSYGDVCLNAGGHVFDVTGMDRFVEADWTNGTVQVEGGLTIDHLLRVAVSKGWFVPVTPGTKFVTLAGAVANDVHGKNHHGMGTIGRHVRRIYLARSDGSVLELSPTQHAEMFAATIGGLGLTGVILKLELALLRIESACLDVETIAVANIDEFMTINAASSDWPYTVAWVDCFAGGADIGRGLYMRGRPAATGDLKAHGDPRISVPIDAPSTLLNPVSMRAFNTVYRRMARRGRFHQHYNSFFYPLDSIGAWNRLYGSRGFYQFQCVVPMTVGRDAIRNMLAAAAAARQGSFLIVLKTFGDLASPGILSFPKPGITLALDFPNKGDRTFRLLERLNAMAIEAGGRIYPAKDATMTGDQFRAAYPRWEEVERLRDPAVLSDFWRRVTGITA